MADHYLELNRASKTKERKIAWCSSVGPAELLQGMGFLVYFPENHAAMLGALRRSKDVMQSADKEDHAGRSCSYRRSDVGAFLANTTPLSNISSDIGSPPHPDVLVYNTNQCRVVKDWFTWYAKRLNAPCIGIESPRGIDEVTDVHIQTVAEQIRSLIPLLETIAFEKFDIDRLRHAVQLSKQCSDLWKSALDSAMHRPSPLSFHAALTLMGPAVVARGTEAAVKFMRQLNEELDLRIKENLFAIKTETHRIYWEGMPVWGHLSELQRLFMSMETAVTASTYCNSWIFDAFDGARPIESMASAYLRLFIVRSDAAKERYLADMVRRFGVEGIVFHESRTCPNNSNSSSGIPERLRRSLGIRTLTIHGDHADPSFFNIETLLKQIESFIDEMK
jgi:benzoyl-CoA reductase/2-hydroxyglutaryl-CoA dehydratase subunit BcrC/BadD/HgdB